MNNALFQTENHEKAASAKAVPRGILSSTTLACQIGVLASGSWVGEETAILLEPLAYTVTAKGSVTALAIKLPNLSKLPIDCLSELAKKAKAKTIWITKRIQNLSETAADVLNSDAPNRIYQKCISQISQRFPQASEYAVQNLRKLVLKDEKRLSPATFHRLGYISRKAKSVSTSGQFSQLLNQSAMSSQSKTISSEDQKTPSKPRLIVAKLGSDKKESEDPYSFLPKILKRCSAAAEMRKTRPRRINSFSMGSGGTNSVHYENY